jgi:protein FAM50
VYSLPHFFLGDFQANFHRPTDTDIHTVEGNVAGARAASLEKKRQREQEEFEERKKKITFDAAQQKTSIHSKFAGGTGSVIERSFKSKTVGLVSAADFKAAAIEAEKKIEAEQVQLETEEVRAQREKPAKKARKRKLKEKRKIMSTLSFAGDEEAQDFYTVEDRDLDDNKDNNDIKDKRQQ